MLGSTVALFFDSRRFGRMETEKDGEKGTGSESAAHVQLILSQLNWRQVTTVWKT